MEQEFKFDVSEVRRLRLHLAGSRKYPIMTVLLGYSVGLSNSAVIFGYPHMNLVLAARCIWGMVGFINAGWLIYLIHDYRKIIKWRRELFVDMETQLADFKREIEAKGCDPITSAGAVMKMREELTRLIP
jgi:hypothetical protein